MAATIRYEVMLELALPPLARSDMKFLFDVTDADRQWRQSAIYAIGRRAPAKITDVRGEMRRSVVHFQIRVGTGPANGGRIRVDGIKKRDDAPGESRIFEAFENLLLFWNAPPGNEDRVLLDWFTTEKLLLDRTNGHPAVEGLRGARELATYDLVQVGIVDPNLDPCRLFDEQVAKIKSADTLLSSSADEAEYFLFLFTVDSDGTAVEISPDKLISGVASALVKLTPRKEPPTDGSGLPLRILLLENITFHTSAGRIKGQRGSSEVGQTELDCLLVQGGKITFQVVRDAK